VKTVSDRGETRTSSGSVGLAVGLLAGTLRRWAAHWGQPSWGMRPTTTFDIGEAAEQSSVRWAAQGRRRAVWGAGQRGPSLIVGQEQGELAGNVESLIVVLHRCPRIEVPSERLSSWFVTIAENKSFSSLHPRSVDHIVTPLHFLAGIGKNLHRKY